MPATSTRFSLERENWFFIFDNAEEADMISQFWLGSKHGSVLINHRQTMYFRH